MEDLIISLVQNFPVLSTVFIVVGILRAINKPLFSLLKTIVDMTPTKSDDEIFDSVVSSKTYQTVTYVLDWLTSVKLPTKGVKK